MDATTYKYRIEMEYVSGNSSVRIDETQIVNMVADYDYENLHMPILYITLTLDKKFIDRMNMNSNTDLINLSVYKYVVDSSNTAGILYFRDQFTYFMKEPLNPDDAIDYGGERSTREDIFKTTIIGLMSLKNINDNKHTINAIFNNTTMINAIQLVTGHIKNLLIEPLDYNTPLGKNIIIPPKNTVSNALKFLNNLSVFYKTQYRFFLDFNGGYILSRNGNAVQTKNETISSIIFDIGTVKEDMKYFGSGMIIDKQNKMYLIPALYNAECVTHSDEYVTEKLYTNIKTVSTAGKNNSKILDINNSDYNNSNDKFIRLGNDNINKINNITSTIESNRVVVIITKQGLDASVFTPNKIYTINNYSPLSKSNASGKFILTRKREQYNGENKVFTQNIYLTFKKVGNI